MTVGLEELLTYARFCQGENAGFGTPHKVLPNIPFQRRSEPARASIADDKIMGADTETIDGKIWLLSTETGVYEIDTFEDLICAFYHPTHCKIWRAGSRTSSSARGARNASKGYSPAEFFYFNLKYDAQAIFRLIGEEFEEDDVLVLLASLDLEITTEILGQQVTFKMKYLEGKYFQIEPKEWLLDGMKMGKIHMWDISQFYGKMGLNAAALRNLNESKIEILHDGTILDIARVNEKEYREKYVEDIKKYAIQDAILAGKLARKKKADFNSANVRFIRPYSLANVAQRNLLDNGDIPTINEYTKTVNGMELLSIANTSYTGGWFEAVKTGTWTSQNCDAVRAKDLTSAYPYVMYNLCDISSGTWVRDNDPEGWELWIANRKPMDIGFCEVSIVFSEGQTWHPLTKLSKSGTLVSPRVIKGWFTADEIVEAKKWPHDSFLIGEWCYFKPATTHKPFASFVDKFFTLKHNTKKGTPEYEVAKILPNSAYGKTIQAVDDKAGKMWNPFYAATITGYCRSLLSEINRLNNYTAISYATDGVIFPNGVEDLVVPPRRLEAPYDLGNWSDDGVGDLLLAMSGVYSMRSKNLEHGFWRNESYSIEVDSRLNPNVENHIPLFKYKTTFRGTAAYFLRHYADGGLFRFCEENQNISRVSTIIDKPYSAKEARFRGDLSLMNVFVPRRFSFNVKGDSTKRRAISTPSLFGDLLHNQYESTAPYSLELRDMIVEILEEEYDVENSVTIHSLNE